MTQHETYDPILARLRVAMDDVPAFCHTSYAPFATPEQYRQRKDHLGGHKGAAPLFVVTQVIRDSLRAKNGTHPTDGKISRKKRANMPPKSFVFTFDFFTIVFSTEAIKKKRRRMMQRIHEYLARLLEMKNEGASPLERIDALEDISNRELRRSGLFRTMIIKMG